ncbi:MAG: 4-deoxy-4-formamido-L-arabinose-phosphoundecaprenol deformylase [Gammaproteobacteria bacterium]|nr:4-deoxy-4-formamido-L-arabinose-phosphoundecaprenol deformylase [Gammaproteobacteria bacterium]MBV9696775.1 4-deoxy-4-formamido-L-arabinose-phosphoundecaprenol deformylase [Gammaproteobacteria bacterium]
MALIALKVDVDTLRGTQQGALRLADLLERCGARATFLFSLGPDHTGRAIRRVFRRGFLGKVRRTSVLEHYGLRTLLYGVLLPGPHIGRRGARAMQQVAEAGFEVGVHTWDHVRWQDRVAAADAPWTQRELTLACEQFMQVFGRRPQVHGAAGWQVNEHVPGLEAQLGFRYASDTRGRAPFRPQLPQGGAATVAQLPTTLPTLDELIGREDLGGEEPVTHLLRECDRVPGDHVFTLHAELEGGAYLAAFERLLREWRARGYELTDLASYAGRLHLESLPVARIVYGTVPGRSGTLALQAA